MQIEDLAPRDILRFISEGTKLERQTRLDSTTISAGEAGDAGASGSLADTIIAAYKRRMEDGNND